MVKLDLDDAAIRLLRDLVSAQTGGEDAVQALISACLQAMGCDVTLHNYDPAEVPVKGEFAIDTARNAEHRSAVLGELRGDPELPSLLIFAHPDSEPVSGVASWHHDPFAGEINGGRFYGWGVADDLAGCAAALLAIERTAATNVPMGSVIFASTPSKRYARGVAALLHDGLTSDASLYLHPAESGAGMREIKAVASGQLEFRIEVTGREPATTEPGHTAFSHLAVNPIDKALVIRDALMALAEERRVRIRHPLIEADVGRATNLHISRIACGEMCRLSRIEHSCTLGGAISFPPGEALEDVKAEVEEAVRHAAKCDDWLRDEPPVLIWVTGMTGAEVPVEHPLFRTTAAAVTSVVGDQPHVNPMHTASDIRNPIVEAGIPCVGLGCLGGDLSQNGRHDEWVDVADFLRMVNVTTQIVANWCGAKESQHP